MMFKSLFILCVFLYLPSKNLMANAAYVLNTIDKFNNEFEYEFNKYFHEAKSQPKLGGNIMEAFQMLGNIKQGIPTIRDRVTKFLWGKSMGTFIIIEKGLKDILNVLKTMIHSLKQDMKIIEGKKEPAQLLEAAERLKAPQKEERGMDLGMDQEDKKRKIEEEMAEENLRFLRINFIEKLIKMCQMAIQYLNTIYEELQTVQRGLEKHSADAGTSSIHSDMMDIDNDDKAIVVSSAALDYDDNDKYNNPSEKTANVMVASFDKISLPAGSLAKVELFLGDYIVLETVQQKKEAIKNCIEELNKIKQRSNKIAKLQLILEKALKMPVDEKQKKFLGKVFEMFAPNRKNRILLFQIKEKFVNALNELNSRREFDGSIKRAKKDFDFNDAPKEFNSIELEYIKKGNKLFQEKFKSFLPDLAKNLNLMNLIGKINYLTRQEQALIIKPNQTPIEMNKVQKCEETIKSFDQLIEAILCDLFDISATDGHQHNEQSQGEQEHSSAVQPSQGNHFDLDTLSIQFDYKCNPEETADVMIAALDKIIKLTDREAATKELITAIVNCNNEQRHMVKVFLDKKLGEKWKSEKLRSMLVEGLGKDLAELVWELMKESGERDAKLLHRNMYESHNNLEKKIRDIVLEIMISRNKTEWANIKRAFYEKEKKFLENEIAKYIASTEYKHFFVNLCAGIRQDENYPTNLTKAQKDAKELYRPNEIILRKEAYDFMFMLASQSYAQLRLLFEEYDKLRNPNSLEKDVQEDFKDQFNEDVKNILLAFIAYAKNPHLYFATRFEEKLQGYYKFAWSFHVRMIWPAFVRNTYKNMEKTFCMKLNRKRVAISNTLCWLFSKRTRRNKKALKDTKGKEKFEERTENRICFCGFSI